MSQEIANTILTQIRAGAGVDGKAGTICLMAWGARAFRWHRESSDEGYLGALSFIVRGFRFRGYVKVKLMYSDTYTISFSLKRDGKAARDPIEDVYFDQLTEILDDAIEVSPKTDIYQQQCKAFMANALSRI